MKDKLVYGTGITETHLGLGRMHIDVDGCRVDLQKQAVSRITATVQHVLPGFTQRMGEQFVAHETAIHIAILCIAARPRMRWQGTVTRKTERARPGIDVARFGQKILAENRPDTARCLACGQMQTVAAIVREGEGVAGMRQRNAFDDIEAMRELGRFGFEEFAPCRGVVVEVAHFDDRSGCQCGRLRLGIRFASQTPGMAGPRFPAGQRQAGDRSHRSERLATKTERCHPFKIIQRGKFRRGVTRQRQCQLLPGDAATVVGHPDQLDPALFQLNLQGVATRIKRVFQQFLEHRSRTFHHLARRNLADQQVGQQADDRGRTRLGRHGADYTGR